MRYPQDHKTETRQGIVDAASKAFRMHGVTGVSVSQIMADAGLTVGGFYRHFESKDELFQEALESSMAETLGVLKRPGGDSRLEGVEWLQRAAAVYLSHAHRNLCETGCPLPALTTEVARQGKGFRQSFGDSLQELVEEIAAHIDPEDPKAGYERAWGFLATLVGSLLLSRGVADDRQAGEILSAGRSAAVPEAGPDHRGS